MKNVIVIHLIPENHRGMTISEIENEYRGIKKMICNDCGGNCWISHNKRELAKKLERESKSFIYKCLSCSGRY